MTITLRYLDFDYSEDTEGHGNFDAMASTAPHKLHEVHAEIAQVLAWAHANFPEGRGAAEDGATWDFDLQQTRESVTTDTLAFDEQSGKIDVEEGSAQTQRCTVTFSISGTSDFCAELRAQFALD